MPGQVVKEINDYLQSKNKPSLSEELVKSLTEQIESIEDPNQRIRDLIQKRIVDFCKQLISSTNKTVPQVVKQFVIFKLLELTIGSIYLVLINPHKTIFD